MSRPNMALARLTNDSIASDSKPTESVNHQARVLRAMVTSATPIDAESKRLGVNQWVVMFMRSAYTRSMKVG